MFYNHKTILSIAAAVLWLLFIFLLSSIPGEHLGPDTITLYLIQKIGHALLFGVLSVLVLSILRTIPVMTQRSYVIFLFSFLITILCAAADEYHQSFTSGRHPSIADVAIDAFGAVVFLACIYLYTIKKRTVLNGIESVP